MRTERKKEKFPRTGFTLIEVCIVTIISGLLFVSAFELYAAYSKQTAFDTTYSNINDVNVQLTIFEAKRGRYPCPADRSLPVGNANYGKETGVVSGTKCDLTAAPWSLTPGNCYYTDSGGVGHVQAAGTNGFGGVCMFACSHPGPPTDPVGTRACGDGTGAANNAIVIGAVPIATLRAINGVSSKNSTSIMYDGWGDELDYVVTYNLTNANTWEFDHGAITVHDENGQDTAGITNDGHFGLVSHGPDGKGAYGKNGVQNSVCGAVTPQSYGSGDDQNCANDGTFISGISRTALTALHYDDVVNFTTVGTGGLWAKFPGSSDIENVNLGRVNVGTANDPLDSGGLVNANVTLNVGDPTGGSNGNIKAANNVKAAQICDKNGSNCFDINALTKATGSEVIKCTAPQVMVGIYTDSTGCGTPPCTHAKCQAPQFTPAASIPDQDCPGGEWLVGISTDGKIICHN